MIINLLYKSNGKILALVVLYINFGHITVSVCEITELLVVFNFAFRIFDKRLDGTQLWIKM